MEKTRICIVIAIIALLLGCGPSATPTPSPTDRPEPTRTAEPTPSSVLPDAPTGWERIEPGGATRCANGTPYAFYVRPGSVEKPLIYFQGSGLCWSTDTCAQSDRYYFDEIRLEEDALGGILDFENPDNPFKDFHVVYVPLCAADLNWGDNLVTYADANGQDLTIHHVGFVNTSAALDWVYEQFPAPESIFVYGCSSGAWSSIIFAPYLIEHYPDVLVTQLGDSSHGFGRIPAEWDTQWEAWKNFPEWIPELVELVPGESLGEEVYLAVAHQYPGYTFSQYNETEDEVVTWFRQQVMREKLESLKSVMEASLSTIHSARPNFRSFTARGITHCALSSQKFFLVEADGVRLTDWVRELAEKGTVNSVKGEGVNIDIDE
jgi:hypothetical protein